MNLALKDETAWSDGASDAALMAAPRKTGDHRHWHCSECFSFTASLSVSVHLASLERAVQSAVRTA